MATIVFDARRCACGDGRPTRWRADRRGAFGADAPGAREGHVSRTRRAAGGALARVPVSAPPPRPAGYAGSGLSAPAEGDLRARVFLASARGLPANDDAEDEGGVLVREVRPEHPARPAEPRGAETSRVGRSGRVGMRDVRRTGVARPVDAISRPRSIRSVVMRSPRNDGEGSENRRRARTAGRTRPRKSDSRAPDRNRRTGHGTRSLARPGRPAACRRSRGG